METIWRCGSAAYRNRVWFRLNINSMKLHTLVAGALFLFSAGAAAALEITFTSSASISGPSAQGGTLNLSLPLFDLSNPDIPDNASIQGVAVTVTTAIIGYFNLWNNTATQIVYNGTASVRGFFSPPLGNLSKDFIFDDLVVAPGRLGGMGFALNDTRSLGSPAAVFSPGAGSVPYISGYGIYDLLSLSPSTNQNPLTGTYLFSEMSSSSIRASITYTYGVPEGGSSAIMLGLGLLGISLQRLGGRD